ncbi:Structural maintenance of chromosomes protein 5 [Dermatophagoides pteronyssinus]|uniref:Structural maintenance of chromosomes protein 5 n=1 Tax=Dermatophagoides pteronyssinus TaxID=6956 RepID=A0ABQ8J1I9_DERPT|nr:Structural maintenance of chromosomes protein 5 [Dermatophagoides pteronyssinus]
MNNGEKFRNFKLGSIVRIELENFMIYKHIEFFPGPFLNLILGPNGSGKSALVCSIIMGFGGDPQITGRSSNLIDYVRTGANFASIIIEIYNPDPREKNQQIQREIRISRSGRKTECHTVWRLNRKTVKKESIMEFTKQMNIDVNNLCQILPQERVVEFSRLNSKDLLFSTEKSIGNFNMYEKHMELIALSHSIVDLEQRIRQSKAFLAKYKNFQTNIEPDLKLIQDKKRFEEQIEWLRKKQVWIEFEEKRLIYVADRQRLNEKKKEFDEFQSRIEPIKIDRDKAMKTFEKIQMEKGKYSSEMQKYLSILNDLNDGIEKLRRKRQELVIQYRQKLSEHKNDKDRLAQFEQDYRNYTNELEDHPNMNNLETDSAEIHKKLEEFDKKIKENIFTLNSHRNRYENSIGEQRFHLNRKKEINNLFNARMEKLNRKDSSIQTAYEWLMKNRQNFQGEIFPPLITQINVLDNKYANAVEMAIGSTDMSTFLFENLSDLEYFNENLKKDRDIRCNVAMIPLEEISDKPTFDIEQYRSFGIFGTVRDLFTAPKKVMSYLIKNYHLNSIPVGDLRTEDKIQDLINQSNFRKIITSKSLYSIVISSYDGEKSTQIVSMMPAKYLNIIIDEKELDEIDQTLNLLEKQIADSNEMIRKYSEENDSLKENRNKLSNELKNIESTKNALNKLRTKIREKERQINSLKNSLQNENKYKEELVKNLEQLHQKELNLLENLPEIIQEAVEKNKNNLLATSKFRIISRIKDALEIKYRSSSSELMDLANAVDRLKSEMKESQNQAKEFRKNAIEKSGFDYNDLDEQIRKRLEELPDTIDEISDAITELKLRCEGIKNVDQSLLETYRSYQKEIQTKSVELEKFEQELQQHKEEIDQLKPVWLNELKTLIAKINENFSKFMDHLNYSGEVYLFTGDKEYSFDDYGIRIKVKFRDAEMMKDLDAYHQSGGERSVSTMIYMLSLQELAHVPFRVVDEINQGMDEKNERCVFDLIAEVSKRNSSQYFLLSPKLLTKLKYTDEMKIHIIFNGPHTYVNFNKSIENLLMVVDADDNHDNIDNDDGQDEQMMDDE